MLRGVGSERTPRSTNRGPWRRPAPRVDLRHVLLAPRRLTSSMARHPPVHQRPRLAGATRRREPAARRVSAARRVAVKAPDRAQSTSNFWSFIESAKPTMASLIRPQLPSFLTLSIQRVTFGNLVHWQPIISPIVTTHEPK